MSLPAQDEIKEPLLTFIYFRGGSRYRVEANATYGPIADFLGLSQKDRELTRDDRFGDGRGESIWNNSVQRARKKLLEIDGYLRDVDDSGRGVWALSQSGIEAAKGIAIQYETHFMPRR